MSLHQQYKGVFCECGSIAYPNGYAMASVCDGCGVHYPLKVRE